MAEEKRQMIHGVEVVFPCKPYPSQFSMMEKVIKGIERRQNCLLESPTGSGKSLALLCSALAWQTAEYNKRAKELSGISDKDEKKPCFKCQNKSVEKRKSVETDASTSGIKNNICDVLPHFDGDDDDDFKQPSNFRTPSNNNQISPDPKPTVSDWFKISGKTISSLKAVYQKGRKHLTISYFENSPVCEDKNASPNNVTEDVPCSCCTNEQPKARKVPKIYFGTRTHKQIAQIVRELKKTAYREVKMTILAAREHTCIHPAVSKMKSKNEGCKELLDGPGCKWNDRLKRMMLSQDYVKKHGLTEAWDIEDFVNLATPLKFCPYFATRDLKGSADIVFCPYNYLIDPVVRSAMEISLKDQIVILDEAHNMEDTARDAAGECLTDDSLEKAINEMDEMIKYEIKTAEHLRLRQLCSSILGIIRDNLDNMEQVDYDQEYKCWSGYDIVARLEKIGVGPKHFKEMQKNYADAAEEASDRENSVRDVSGKEIRLSNMTLQTLEHIVKVLDYLYRNDLKYVTDYRMAVVKSTVYTRNVNTDDTWLNPKRRKGGMTRQRSTQVSLNFWCMNPGVAFSDLAVCRNVVLTSGTLSPVTSFESELGVPFPIKLEANHVIEDKQVWVGSIGQGPRGGTLTAVYKSIETWQFQDELGELVLRVCQQVPHGVLCFVPSYSTLSKLQDRWQNTGVWSAIAKKKDVMVEPRASERVDFEDLMNQFYDCVHAGLNHSGENEKTGALFLAVFRGKVSEGMDFADNYARAVITVGIPYPNFKDVQVKFKRQFNDMYKNSRGLLSGSEWYDIQAFRALNQALGRCIRHRKDWGAIILVDDRFVKNGTKLQGLSKWVRHKVQAHHNFHAAMDSLQKFTKARIEDMPIVNPDTSFIPGTPVTPGQAQPCRHPQDTSTPVNTGTKTLIPETYTSQSTETKTPSHIKGFRKISPATSTPVAPGSVNQYNPTPKNSSENGTPQKSIVVSPNTLLASPNLNNSYVTVPGYSLLSPTEISKNPKYQSLVQQQTVVQTQLNTENQLALLINQQSKQLTLPINQQTSQTTLPINQQANQLTLTINQQANQLTLPINQQPDQMKQIALSATQAFNQSHMSQVLQVINSSTAPKDKSYYIMIDKGLPSQQLYLVEPPKGTREQSAEGCVTTRTIPNESSKTLTINQSQNKNTIDLTSSDTEEEDISKQNNNSAKLGDVSDKRMMKTLQNQTKKQIQSDLKSEKTEHYQPSDSKTNRFFKFCKMSDDAKKNTPFKTPVKKTGAAQPVTPTLFDVNSQEDEEEEGLERLEEFRNLKREGIENVEVPSMKKSRKPLFRQNLKSTDQCEETVEKRKCEDDSKETSLSTNQFLSREVKHEERDNLKETLVSANHMSTSAEIKSEGTEDGREKVQDGLLKTRRGRRGLKRMASKNTSSSKRKKGVDFLDGIEETKENQTNPGAQVTCKKCGQLLIPYLPGAVLNSVWNEEAGCCIQYVCCTGCSKTKPNPNIIGAQIVCVDGSKASEDLEPLQTWLIASEISVDGS